MGGEGGNAQVDVSSGDLQADASVLRQSALGDVQAGHNLEAGNDRQSQMLWRRGHFVERAIDTVADFKFVLKGFKMNVTGAVLHRLKQHEIDKANDRRLVGQICNV